MSVDDVDETFAPADSMNDVEPSDLTLAGDSATLLHDGGQEEAIM